MPRITTCQGMLAAAHAGRFLANALIDAWMAERGLAKSEVTPLDRLAYMAKTGDRGAGVQAGARFPQRKCGSHEMKSLVEDARKLTERDLTIDAFSKASPR